MEEGLSYMFEKPLVYDVFSFQTKKDPICKEESEKYMDKI